REARMRPVARRRYEPMMDRVEVDVVQVGGEISVIADGVLPEAPLPDSMLSLGEPTGVPLWCSVRLQVGSRERLLDQTPARREFCVSFRQRPQRTQMIGSTT